MLNIREFFNYNNHLLKLNWLVGEQNSETYIKDESFESAEIVGHLNLIHPYRIHVFGKPEINYYNQMDSQRRSYLTSELFSARPPALIIAENQEIPNDILHSCKSKNIPLLATSQSAATTIELLRIQLGKLLAPRITMHGVFIDVLGIGVLITGESGLGKSELGLELLTRGHGLVADDAIDLVRIAPEVIEGKSPDILKNLIEVRGLGLLNIKTIFGESSIRRKFRLRLIVHLERRSLIHEYDRLPLEDLYENVLGLQIRKVTIPVAAGRNLAVLVEAAVRNTILQLRGIDTMQEFAQRQKKEINKNSFDGLSTSSTSEKNE
ncbi:MAG: HPr kinase/phosphorylase [Betaproteobacteria bacterium TMED156]|nr:MAG: HPr kinase/phosphorylase [Betaproteobacteria bacterium TMED156]|tara:strand:+ start:161 stop:1126 length:966 start_codon:yes stop_codon:yes gene_type:complete